MLLKNITDVFFDLDHTLWDFDKNSEMAFDVIFKKNHPDVDTALFIEKYIPINQACWKLYQKDQISHEQLRYDRLKLSFDALNYAIADAAIHQMAEDYIELLPENNFLFEGTIDILEYLHQKYSLHIITNGFAAVQDRKIKNSNLEIYFKSITNSEMAGVKKPNPIIFEHALEVSNAQKEHSVMIGDCLDADVKGALNAGFQAIFFNPNQVPVDPEIKQVKHLLELQNFL
jgi:YjjG family noncanonical pyrimidine nucleotidase